MLEVHIFNHFFVHLKIYLDGGGGGGGPPLLGGGGGIPIPGARLGGGGGGAEGKVSLWPTHKEITAQVRQNLH